MTIDEHVSRRSEIIEDLNYIAKNDPDSLARVAAMVRTRRLNLEHGVTAERLEAIFSTKDATNHMEATA